MNDQQKPIYHYKNVGGVGHCLILAQIIGTEPTGEEVPSFFAVYMITKDGKPGCCLEEAGGGLQRITNNVSNYEALIGFCQGYTLAAQERRGAVMPWDWRHKQTIDHKTVETLQPDELKRLRAWPRRPGDEKTGVDSSIESKSHEQQPPSEQQSVSSQQPTADVG